MTVSIPFTSQEAWHTLRAKDITSTDVAALFNLSPYLTAFELWHRKKKGIPIDIEPSDLMRWGSRLQTSIAEGIAEDEGWTIRRMDEYMRDQEMKIGASFDFSIENTGMAGPPIEVTARPKLVIASKESNEIFGKGLLEIKNISQWAARDGWDLDGDVKEAPPHIEIQVQHQLLVSGRAFAYIGGLIGGNKVVLIKRAPQPDIHAAILKKVAAFWASIEANQPPEPDFSRDAKFVSKLFGYAEPGKVSYDVPPDLARLARTHYQLGVDERRIKAERETLKAQMLTLIGEAEKVFGDDFTITAGVVGPTHVSYDRDGYRNFRVVPKTKGGWK